MDNFRSLYYALMKTKKEHMRQSVRRKNKNKRKKKVTILKAQRLFDTRIWKESDNVEGIVIVGTKSNTISNVNNNNTKFEIMKSSTIGNYLNIQ